jgi:hypothetical protein
MITTFVDEDSTRKRLYTAIKLLNQSLDAVESAINENGSHLRRGSYQLLTNMVRAVSDGNKSDRHMKMLFDELIQTSYKLEIQCHGAGCCFIRGFHGYASELLKSKHNIGYGELVEHNQEEEGRYNSLLMNHARPATSSELATGNLFIPPETSQLVRGAVKEAVYLAGLDGVIRLEEEQHSQVMSVELGFGYNFKVNPFKGLVGSSIAGTSSWSRTNSKVMLVDGMIEKVSELDRVLRRAYDTKIPLVLIAQGFSEEVIGTIHANNSRNSFDVMPLRLEQSLESLNMLNDIAVVCGGDVINTLKGDLLIYADFDAFPLVEQVSITKNVMTVRNDKTRKSVMTHLAYLNERRREQASDACISDISDLTTKRIQNLLSHTVKVGIPHGMMKAVSAELDNGIRSYRSVLTYGLLSSDLISDPHRLHGLSTLWQSMHRSMTGDLAVGVYVPSQMLPIAAAHAAKLAAIYFTAGGSVVAA